MKRKMNIVCMAASAFILLMALSLNVSADESNFTDYTYRGTGYTSTEWTSNIKLIAKIDTYYYQNLRDEEFCAADVYFYKQNSAGQRVEGSIYGYAVAQFETDSQTIASSGRIYGYENVEAWSGACSAWYLATPHYYGTALGEDSR